MSVPSIKLTEEMYEPVRCNLCGADDPVVIYEARPRSEVEAVELSRRYAASAGDLLDERLVRCSKCDLVYINPRLKPEFIHLGYAAAENSTYLSQGPERIKTFGKYAGVLEKWTGSKGRLLDIGCAGGFFLKAARDAGWDVQGVELSQQMCEYARSSLGLNVRQGPLRSHKFPDAHFDLVTFWDVLEHVEDPMADLREVNRILKPGGTLLINYPDYASVGSRVLGRKWWFLENVHLYYFTPATMTRYFAKCGFKEFATSRHFQRLKLGYLAEKRLAIYSPLVAKAMSIGIGLAGMKETSMPYYASQRNVLARKVS